MRGGQAQDIADVKWPHAKKRRDMLRDMRVCINGPVAPPGTPSSKQTGIVHGEVVRGGKCGRCLEVHRRTR